MSTGVVPKVIVTPHVPNVARAPFWNHGNRSSKANWQSVDSRRKFFDGLAIRLNVQQQEDWYKIRWSDLKGLDSAQAIINRYYDGSITRALYSIYPELKWDFWKFERVPKDMFSSPSLQREVFDEAAKELGMKSVEEWYLLDRNTILKHPGVHKIVSGLYEGSLQKALESVYSEHQWLPWKFRKVPAGYWNDISNQRKFFDWLGTQLDIKNMEDWYHVKYSYVIQHGGAPLLNEKYQGSLMKALSAIYPEHKWQEWMFGQVSKDYWTKEENVLAYLMWNAEHLGITNFSDWLSVSQDQLPKFNTIRKLYGGLVPLLQRFFPDHDWKKFTQERYTRLSVRLNKSQTFLFKTLQKIFPEEELKMDFRHPSLFHKNSNREMEFDVYIPSLGVAFEYQSQHHYNHNYLLGSPERQQEIDEEKRTACKDNNITLIEIPYWWDRSKNTLVATILKNNPDLIKDPQIAALGKGYKPLNPADYTNLKSSKQGTVLYSGNLIPLDLDDSNPYGYALMESRGKAKCRNCQKFLAPKTPRVVVKGLFVPVGSGAPHRARYSLCVDPKCFHAGIEKYDAKNKNNGIVFPKFDGTIHVEGKKDELLKLINNAEWEKDGQKVEWIFEENSNNKVNLSSE